MTQLVFTPAKAEGLKGRIALYSIAGGGKTYTALSLASRIGKKIALIDTEHNSAKLYAKQFTFDRLPLTDYSPSNYIAAIRAAESQGYDVVIVDSLSHAWMGKGGVLEMVNKSAKGGNTFQAWKDATPAQNELIESILACKCHVIATMRAKTQYEVERVEKGGRTISQPKKIGLGPIQRDGIDFEFDLIGQLDDQNTLTIVKSRSLEIPAGTQWKKPGSELGDKIKSWLDGADSVPVVPLVERVKSLLAANEISEIDLLRFFTAQGKECHEISDISEKALGRCEVLLTDSPEVLKGKITAALQEA